MHTLNTSKTQQIINKCNSMVDFTHCINDTTAPWIVSIENICETKNPSLITDLNLKVKKVFEDSSNGDIIDSVGGWLDQKTGLYHVDANVHFYDKKLALAVAEMFKQKAIYNIDTDELCYTPDYE